MIHETIQSMRQSWSVNKLTDFVVDSVQAAHAGEAPFYHLRFDRVFPDDFYVEMLQAMPVAEDYRAMSGKSKMGSSRPDGKPTRAKIDLFPEYIRHLPPNKGTVWEVAGRVLRSKELKAAFVQKRATAFCSIILSMPGRGDLCAIGAGEQRISRSTSCAI